MRYTLNGFTQYEEDIKRSRFLALAGPAQDASTALDFVAQYSEPDATHNCWAYRVLDNYRFNDDGEPGGTAGRPIMQAIDGQECDQVVVLVIRWFGGVKLGTGGLIRAYGGVAAQCLRLADKSELVDETEIRCHCPYTDIDLLRSRLVQFQGRVADEEFGIEGVVWRIIVPSSQADDLRTSFTNLTRGQVRFFDPDSP
ncbi:IMPACT family protein [Paenalcaligenes niemegkensis]|uniref:IMPACT family protein n=1 Tax=Paenalcaligenes niemegkensis TaxID=2895469 RepID=UPI001EE8A756|nr:YigZ family protein [Paenalcaligenes niemegkensis]MCQ9616237.1 IMPACT family protein [Paenalcaligenes niemegkensis]